MATKDKDKKRQVLKAPTPTYTKIDPANNASFVPPTPKVRSNIVVSQADLMPVQQQPQQERQPIQVRGALSAPQPKKTTMKETVDFLTAPAYSPMNAPGTSGAGGFLMNKLDNITKQTKEAQKEAELQHIKDSSGFLMNKVTPGATISPPNVQQGYTNPKSKGIPSAMTRILGSALDSLSFGATDQMTDKLVDWMDETTRPKILDDNKSKALETAGSIVGMLGSGTGAYRAGAKVLKPIVSRLPGIAGSTIAPLATRVNPVTGALLNLGAQGIGRTAGSALTGAAGGALYRTPIEIINEIKNPSEQDLRGHLTHIATDTALGGALTPAIDTYGSAIGQLLRRRMTQNNIPQDEVENILSQPLGGTSPTIEPPTTARIAQQKNPYREQFEELIRQAKEQEAVGGLTPGRENVELEQMWAAMAGQEGISLDELIQRAYPTRPNRVQPDLVQRAKEQQRWREVVGAPMPVKSIQDRSPQLGQTGTPEGPIPARSNAEQQGERVAESSRTRIEPRGALGEQPTPQQTGQPSAAIKYEPQRDLARWIQTHIAGYGLYGGRAFTDAGDKTYSNLFKTLNDKLMAMDVLNPKPGELEEVAALYDDLKNYVYSKGGQADFDSTGSFKGVEDRIGRKTPDQSQPAPQQPATPPAAGGDAGIPPAPPVGEPGTPRQNPKQNERGLYSNIESTEVPTPEVRDRMARTDRSYMPITNEETVAAANKRVADDLNSAISYARNGKADAEKVATGFRALQELQNAGRFQEAADLVDSLAERLTRAGQEVQAASIISRLSPEGQLLRITRRVNEINKTRSAGNQIKLDAETTQKITESAQAAQAARLSQERAAEVLQITEKLRAGQQLDDVERQTLSDFADDMKAFISEEKPDITPPKPTPDMKNPRKRDRIVKWLEEKAAAAMERLNRRRNNLSANPFDTWADMGIVTAAKLAKRGLKFSDYTTEMVQEFGESVRPYLQKAYNQGKKVLTREAKLTPSAQARAAQRAIQNQLTSTEAGKVAEKYIQGNAHRMDHNDINNIRNIAMQLSSLQGKTRVENEMILQQILNNYEKSSLWDKVQALRYIAMLFNTSTQAVNALSGPMMATMGTISDILPTMVDSALSATLKRPRNITLYGTNPLRFLGQWFKNAKVGGKAGWQGVNPEGIAGANDIRGLTFKGKANPLGWLERGLGAVAKGADYGTYKTVQQSELRRAAYLDAKNSGVKGRDAIKRHIENFMANPTPEALDQADKIARNTTFQRSDTLGGQLASGVAGLKGKAGYAKPVIGAIAPFIRTPVNIASTAVTLTPAGLIKGLVQLSSKSEASQREALRTLGLSLSGTGLSALGYALSKAGIITGANDSGDKDLDAVREQAGKGKYRFNTSALQRYLTAMLNGDGFEGAERAAKYQEGDKQFDYNKMQPLAFPLSIGAGYEEQKGDVEDKLANAGESAYGSLFSMSTLKGVQDILKPDMTGSQGQKQLGVLTRFAESFAKSLSPSLLAQAARVTDPVQRKTSFNEGFAQDVSEYFKSRTPFLSDSLQPNKTTLGQNKMNTPGVVGQFANPYKSDVAPYTKAAAFISDLIDRTGTTGLAPSPPEKKVSGKDRVTGAQINNRPIPPKRYVQLQQEIGDEIIQKINDIPAEWDDDRKAEAVEKIYSSVRKKYMDKVKKELGIRVSK